MAIRQTANTMIAGDPTHPGILLKEELDAAGLSQKAAAEQMEMNAAILSQIIKGKRSVNARLALKLEALLGIDADFFMRLQTGYDIAVLRRAANARKTDKRKTVTCKAFGLVIGSRYNIIAKCFPNFKQMILHLSMKVFLFFFCNYFFMPFPKSLFSNISFITGYVFIGAKS